MQEIAEEIVTHTHTYSHTHAHTYTHTHTHTHTLTHKFPLTRDCNLHVFKVNKTITNLKQYELFQEGSKSYSDLRFILFSPAR